MIEAIGWIAIVVFLFSTFLWIYTVVLASEAFFKHFPRKRAIKRLITYLFSSIIKYPRLVLDGWDLLTDKNFREQQMEIIDEGCRFVAERERKQDEQ